MVVLAALVVVHWMYFVVDGGSTALAIVADNNKPQGDNYKEIEKGNKVSYQNSRAQNLSNSTKFQSKGLPYNHKIATNFFSGLLHIRVPIVYCNCPIKQFLSYL